MNQINLLSLLESTLPLLENQIQLETFNYKYCCQFITKPKQSVLICLITILCGTSFGLLTKVVDHTSLLIVAFILPYVKQHKKSQEIEESKYS